MTFRQFAEVYRERHVFAKGLAIGWPIDYRLKPLIDHFGDRAIAEIRTADVEDFIADLRKPRVVNRRPNRRLTNASINRTIELLRHMMNWAVGREFLERTPFRRGTETLIRKLREDNQRRRRISEDEEARLLTVAPPLLRSMIITALDTGMRQGEMLELRLGDIDGKRGLIVLRGETTKSRRTRTVPISTARPRAVLEWLRLDADGSQKPHEALVFSDEAGEPIGRFRTAWLRPGNLQAAAARLESGKTFDAPPRASAAPADCQVSVKNSTDGDVEGGADPSSEIEPNSLDDTI